MTGTSQHDSTARPTNPRQADTDLKRRIDTWLDEALKQTFPASDPIASPPGGERPFRTPEEEADELAS